MAQLPNTIAAQARRLPTGYGTVKAAAYLIEMGPPFPVHPGIWVAGAYSAGVLVASGGGAWKCLKSGTAATAPTGQGADPSAWANNTTYPKGSVVQSSGNAYQATFGGTSVFSGGGPIGTGTNIKDGNALTWQYLGALPFPILDTGDGLIWKYIQQLPYPTYRQFFLAALCEGEIVGAVSVFVDQERYAAFGATDLGDITLLKGVDAANQVPGYGDAMGYQHTALIAPTNPTVPGGVQTGTKRELPAYAVEINSVMFGVGTPDVSPADVVNDLLTHTRRGCSWPGSRVGPTVTGTGAGDFRVYCDATGARFSMYIDTQRSALSLLADILNTTNCDAIWSQGALKIVPLGDQPIPSPVYGATGYVPNNTAQYNLSETDFLEPIQITRAPDSDCYNSFPIEFVDRSTVYQRNTVEDPDQTDIDSKGMIWRAATISLPLVFPDGTYPIMLSRIYAQRSLYVRNTYTFKLPWRYLLLEPTDIVTLSDATMGLSLVPVRIVSMREGEDFTWEVVAEEYPAGVAASGAYTPQGGDGYKPNTAGTAAAGIPTAFGSGALTTPIGDNLWPNPTSEISPPAGYPVANDGNSAEWDLRSNLGGGAYAGNWVREILGPSQSLSFTTTALPGDIFYFESQVFSVVAAANKGGLVKIVALDAAGSALASTSSTENDAASWAKCSVTSAAMPAGTVRVRFSLQCGSDAAAHAYFDAVYARKAIAAAGATNIVKQIGNIQITGTNTSGTIAVSEPDANFVVVAQANGSILGSPTNLDCWVVTGVTRTTTLITLNIKAAPGVGTDCRFLIYIHRGPS